MAADPMMNRLETLSSHHREFSEELDPTKASRFLEYYVRLIPRVLNAERCSVFIHDPANNKVWLKAGTGVKEKGIEVSVQDSIVGQVISTGKSLATTGLESRAGAHKATDVTTGFTTRELICVPIRSCDGSRVTGAIQVLNRKGGGEFDAEDRDFLEETGQHFQRVVESIFLGQEAVAVAGEAAAAASRARALSKTWAGVSILVLALWGLTLGLVFLKLGGNVVGL
jgi:GAF domain-containing protein